MRMRCDRICCNYAQRDIKVIFLKDIILLKQGEVVLKGLNKRYFEQKLLANIRKRLK